MKKAILFGLEDTLYDATLQLSAARMNAIKAMVAEGFPIDSVVAYKVLDDIVRKYGNHYPKHFDLLLETFGLKYDARIIAAGVQAYRQTSSAYLIAYPDAMPTLINLRDLGLKLYVVTSGPPVKQWQKIIALGLAHIFHNVFIEENTNIMRGFSKEFLKTVIDRIGLSNKNLLLVSSIPDEIKVASIIGIPTILVIRGLGKERAEEVREVAEHVVNSLKDIIKIAKSLE